METFRSDQNSFRIVACKAELQGLLPQNTYVDDDINSRCGTPAKPMSLYAESIPGAPCTDSAIDTGHSTPYSKADVSETLERLRAEVEALRECISLRVRDKEERIYETIENSKIRKRTKDSITRCHNGHSPSPPPQTRTLWLQARERGFYRLRYVLDPSINICVRIFWLLLFVCAVGAFVYQIRDRVLTYMMSPSNVNVEVMYVDSISFPAVTICNENKFRLTETVRSGMYRTFSALSSDRAPSTRTIVNIAKANMTYKDYLRRITHQKEDLVSTCLWNNQPCSISNFHETFTDHGLCYTFVPDADKANVRKAGQQTSLFLIMNVEQYEYLSDSKPPVGVKFAVHQKDIVPRIVEQGVNAAVGSHTSVAIKRMMHRNLPPPSGSCHASSAGYSREGCLKECERWYVLDNCGCEPPQFEGQDTGPRCNVSTYLTCVDPLITRASRMHRQCRCRLECERIDYEVSLSHASTSVYAAESIVRTLRVHTDLESRVQLARDMQQRVDPSIHAYDAAMLNGITAGLSSSTKNITLLNDELISYYKGYQHNLENLRENLTKLNQTIRSHLDSFNTSVHITFSQAVNHFKQIFAEVAETALNDRTSESMTTAKLNKTAWKILDTLKPLVMSTEIFWFSSGSMLADIEKGVNNFRSDLVFGYGQKYESFRQDKEFYTETTDKILNLTSHLNKILTTKYHYVVNITRNSKFVRNPNPGDKTLRESLKQFFRDLHQIKIFTVPTLEYEFNQLFQTYTIHKTSILHLAKVLIDIGNKFQEHTQRLNRTLDSIKLALSGLSKWSKSLHDELSKVGRKYIEHTYEKTELALRFGGDVIRTTLSKVKTSLRALGTLVRELVESGNSLRSSFRNRITNQERFQYPLLWLSFSPLKNDVDLIKGKLEATVKTITDYLSELSDYLRGNRLNEDFYMNNFLHLELYFGELSETRIAQQESYGIFDLACDLGGTMALYLGICILTIFEGVDFIIKCWCQNRSRRRA